MERDGRRVARVRWRGAEGVGVSSGVLPGNRTACCVGFPADGAGRCAGAFHPRVLCGHRATREAQARRADVPTDGRVSGGGWRARVMMRCRTDGAVRGV